MLLIEFSSWFNWLIKISATSSTLFNHCLYIRSTFKCTWEESIRTTRDSQKIYSTYICLGNRGFMITLQIPHPGHENQNWTWMISLENSDKCFSKKPFVCINLLLDSFAKQYMTLIEIFISLIPYSNYFLKKGTC